MKCVHCGEREGTEIERLEDGITVLVCKKCASELDAVMDEREGPNIIVELAS
jgi:formate dehydrogenase maturation protein FdhE